MKLTFEVSTREQALMYLNGPLYEDFLWSIREEMSNEISTWLSNQNSCINPQYADLIGKIALWIKHIDEALGE
jgi:hypothetical protein